MSWDGIYAKDRYYPEFEPGTEVKTNRIYKKLTRGKGYFVIECFNPSTWNKEDNRRVITIMNDAGFVCPYSTNYFEKTDAELLKERRDNLLNDILK